MTLFQLFRSHFLHFISSNFQARGISNWYHGWFEIDSSGHQTNNI